MRLKPVNDKIVVKPNENKQEERTASGIILPDTVQDGTLIEGEVVAIGEGKGDTVRERLCKYKISKKQQSKIDELLSDKKVENGVLSIIDELNSIEVPTEKQ